MKMTKKLTASILTLIMAFSLMALPVSAASSATWRLDFENTSTGTQGTKSMTRQTGYNSDGYKNTTSTLTGSNDRRVQVTCNPGISGGTKTITTTGTSSLWKLTSSTTGNVTWQFTGVASVYLIGNGTIKYA